MAKPWFDHREVAAAAAVVESGWVSQGARVTEFEQVVAALVGAAHGVAVSNCTTALHLGMIGAGVGAGDDVVVPSLSFVATANAPRYVGARPVFADVDPATHNVTAETIERALTPRTRAIIVVDQYGTPADIEPIRALAAERGLAVVEDAACAIGSTYLGAPVGARSEIATFSFHPRKILVTGEGGMVTLQDGDLAARMRRLRQHGMSVSTFDRHTSTDTVIEQYLETGFNYRLTDIQAAIGLVQADKLPAMIARRRELAARYQRLLADIPGLETVADPAYGTTNFQTFWVMLPDTFPVPRDEVLTALKQRGVNSRHGVTCAHEEPAFADLEPVSLPVSERITRRSVLLPLYHDLSEHDQDRVVEALADVARRPAGRRPSAHGGPA